MSACPLSRHESSVPAQQRLGTHEERIPALAGQHPACGSQECAITHPVDRALYLTAQDRYLVAKHEILKADLLGGAILGGEHAEQPAKQQVEERREHGRDSVTHGWLGASSAQDHGPDRRDRVFVPHALRSRISRATSAPLLPLATGFWLLTAKVLRRQPCTASPTIRGTMKQRRYRLNELMVGIHLVCVRGGAMNEVRVLYLAVAPGS